MTPERIEWLSVEEAMPDPRGDKVLVAFGGECTYPTDAAFWDGTRWRWPQNGTVVALPIIAWAPLPKGPQ